MGRHNNMSEPIQTPKGTEPEPGSPAEPQTPDPNPQPGEPAAPPQDPEPPQAPPAPPANPPQEPQRPDYETKFKESTRENQILNAQLRASEEARRRLTNDPTEDELRAAFPDWEFLTESERTTRTLAFKADRRTQALASEREAEKAERDWKTNVEMAITANPALQGHEEAFREFAMKPTHRLTPMETLVAAFQTKVSTPPANPNPPTPEPGLESGNGGPREPSKPKTKSATELKMLRKTDYLAYQEYIKTHPIDIDAIEE